MPHFGLIDEENMAEDEVLLMRARLHLRSGRRRLYEGKLPDAVAVLYDAVWSAMQWVALNSDWWDSETVNRQNELLEDDLRLHELLQRKGIWHRALNYHELRQLVEQALQGSVPEFDRQDLLNRIEALMTVFGVMPFDENELPPEAPDAF
ncbi:MAG: hypothetical protein ACLFV2_10685 [Desulfurivibrionaceae bacterium]